MRARLDAELFGDEHGQRGVHALAHLGASQKKVMLLSVPMRSQALGSKVLFSPLDFGCACRRAGQMAMTRPPTDVAAA